MNEPEPPLDNRQSAPSDAPDPRRGALIGLLVIVLLILGGIFLTYVLRRESRLQDCVMSGRTNCAPIDATSDR